MAPENMTLEEFPKRWIAEQGAGVEDGMSDQQDADDREYYDGLEDDEPDEDDTCVDCHRIGSHWDVCGVCGATMCSACFEMGCGVCIRGPHK